MFRLRKWYFDFLTPAGEYAYVYFAYITIAGRTLRSLTVHVAHPGGSPVTRSFLIDRHDEHGAGMTDCALGLPCGGIRIGGHDCALDFQKGDCRVRLAYASGTGTPETPVEIVTGRKSRIAWTPVALRYAVSGQVALGDTVVDPGGAGGYADALESTCLPPIVPVHMLYWGRAHHATFDLTYTHAVGRGGRIVCSRFYLQNGGAAQCGPLAFEGDSPRPGASAGAPIVGDYVISGSAGSGHVSARVHRMRAVQESGFIDQQDVRSPLLRGLLRLCTRDPRGAKYLSRAAVSLLLPRGEERVEDLALIDECVRL